MGIAKNLISLTVNLACSVAMFGGAVLASNYPADYCHQVVRIKHDGPGMFAHVGSGCDQGFVIGYKNSGFLAYHNPEKIDVIAVASCDNLTKTTVIPLGKEWNGTGYMSEKLSYYSLKPNNCHKADLSFAFSNGQQWDSNGGYNYGHFGYGMYGNNDVEVFKTHQVGYGNINLRAWEIIVEAMTR